jgi:hypothetical protein
VVLQGLRGPRRTRPLTSAPDAPHILRQQGPPPRTPRAGLFSQLLAKVDEDVPRTFKLPLYLRTEFKDGPSCRRRRISELKAF